MGFTFRKLNRLCREKHIAVTKCSNPAAKWWLKACWADVRGEKVCPELRISVDHHPVSIAMSLLTGDYGMSKDKAKRIVLKSFGNTTWEHFFQIMNEAADKNGGKYQIGDLTFEK